VEAKNPYIMLPNGHDLILGYPDTTSPFDISQRSISHDFTSHLGHSGVSVSFVSIVLIRRK